MGCPQGFEACLLIRREKAVTSAKFETEKHQENWVGQITSELLLTLGAKCLNFLGEEEN